jgi:hypothetical protein
MLFQKIVKQYFTDSRFTPRVHSDLECGHFIKHNKAALVPPFGSIVECHYCKSPQCNEFAAKKAYLRLRDCIGVARAHEVVKGYGHPHTSKMSIDVRELFIQEAKDIAADRISRKNLQDLTLRDIQDAFVKVRKKCGFSAGTKLRQENNLPQRLNDLQVGMFQEVIELCNVRIREANRPKGPTQEDLRRAFDAVKAKHEGWGMQKVFDILGVQRLEDLSEDLYQDCIDACNLVLAKDVTEICPHPYKGSGHNFCHRCGTKLC